MAEIEKTYKGCDCPICMFRWALQESRGDLVGGCIAIGSTIQQIMSQASSAEERASYVQALSAGHMAAVMVHGVKEGALDTLAPANDKPI